MVTGALTRDALDLLARGHGLYTGGRPDPGAVRTAIADRRAAAADAELIRLLSAARADHELGRNRTGAVLDDAYADAEPAADTAMGRREFARRMANRLQAQQHQIRRSHRRSNILARRMRRLSYPTASAIRPNTVHYHRLPAEGRVTAYIAAALDRLGIGAPAARRNWMRGYRILIARESGGRPSAIAAESATAAPGPAQPDGQHLGYARGLTQMIPATFARYHQPGTSTNIYDPVANICASINYVMRRYGVSRDGSNLVALVQQADPHRPPKGY